MNNTIIAWFSCGATSAVACKIALQMYENVEIFYIDTGSAHEDNIRFMSECEQWFGKKIHCRKSRTYSSVQDVLRQTCFINSPYGAPCTSYWNKIRRDFPDCFKEMSEIERDIDATCLSDENGRIFLDELDPYRGDQKQHAIPSCSIICEIEFQSLIDKQVDMVMNGRLNINETS